MFVCESLNYYSFFIAIADIWEDIFEGNSPALPFDRGRGLDEIEILPFDYQIINPDSLPVTHENSDNNFFEDDSNNGQGKKDDSNMTFQRSNADHNFYTENIGANVTVQCSPTIVESTLADFNNPIKLESDYDYDASDEISDVEESQNEDLLQKNCKYFK